MAVWLWRSLLSLLGILGVRFFCVLELSVCSPAWYPGGRRDFPAASSLSIRSSLSTKLYWSQGAVRLCGSLFPLLGLARGKTKLGTFRAAEPSAGTPGAILTKGARSACRNSLLLFGEFHFPISRKDKVRNF